MRALLLGIVCLTTLMAGCAAPQDAPISATTLAQDLDSGYASASDPWVLVLRDEAAWASFWSQHRSRHSPDPERPVVDFTKDMVVAVGLGDRPSGGYGVKAQLAMEHGRLVVTAVEHMPAEGCPAPAIITQPTHIVSVARAGMPMGDPEVRHTVEKVPCTGWS